MEEKMKKNYQKPEIIEEIELDRKMVLASSGPDFNDDEGEGEG